MEEKMTDGRQDWFEKQPFYHVLVAKCAKLREQGADAGEGEERGVPTMPGMPAWQQRFEIPPPPMPAQAAMRAPAGMPAMPAQVDWSELLKKVPMKQKCSMLKHAQEGGFAHMWKVDRAEWFQQMTQQVEADCAGKGDDEEDDEEDDDDYEESGKELQGKHLVEQWGPVAGQWLHKLGQAQANEAEADTGREPTWGRQEDPDEKKKSQFKEKNSYYCRSEELWSEAKTRYCCKTKHLGCPEPTKGLVV